VRRAVRDGARAPAAIRLPDGSDPYGAAFYRGSVAAFEHDLFVGSRTRAQLLRVRVDPEGSPTIERLVLRGFGPIGQVAIGPDGAIYFCTGNGAAAAADIVARLVPLQ
jgi:glucose/arabinose dehydrogenase